MMFFVIILAIIIGVIECIPLVKRGLKKEMYVVVFMLLFAVSIQILSKNKLFKLKDLIESVLEPIGRALFKEM
ncbi:hypothetical protein [Clostridium folliculivorans]|uniref:Uncharacterized protein n=1 Tax=Clostridium folliculivorans TaxID=2886038 RepID=A0A9W5Y1S5_9CLOT|nr:hypothetical protein [Clostridium folliculivorans]GKU24964.1 hypothetical protein CFOLD11_17900 [Clostridium folliculivorans]GKU31062.1 hypothetical protein CFB3_31690 [Clostridium folliculivorans]